MFPKWHMGTTEYKLINQGFQMVSLRHFNTYYVCYDTGLGDLIFLQLWFPVSHNTITVLYTNSAFPNEAI